VRYRYANNLDEEIEKLRYDLYYVKHMSPWLDLRILLETIGVLLRGHAAGNAGNAASADADTGIGPAGVTPASGFGFSRKVGRTTEA
jgi:hypothetical protein